MRFITDTPTPTHVVVQISDTHIVPDGELYHGLVDTLANVAGAFDQIERSGLDVAAILLTGDLADTGDVASYRRLRAYVEKRASGLGLPVLYAMGNHDSRGPFREGLLDAEPTTEPYDYVYWAGDLRVIVLDSTEPGEVIGLLDDAQLDWLAAELATPAPAGTVLALHHPPLPSPIGMLNALVLAEPERLAKVIAGTDVKIVLCGHSHHASGGALAGVPVWVSGASAYSARTVGPAGGYAGVTGGQFTRVDVYPDQAVATAVPSQVGEMIYELTPEMLAKYAAEFEAGANTTPDDLENLAKA
ncbi:metallophosphoesterase [Frankia sp. CNm7]|uniref:Metallophosphoesterase n=1 Tax=Frankia nepalensis TaxID=1836974 RepID=A0A937RCK8_9ACTN|nr:metallophosphoesterase [Frankia nepalensis]MBL7495284.1 metallophosphoesterase [Frankia nepalensis]MBL7515543.1 metallophosphoesterase [Frankia nepalensis]MBL7524453.1 metallophosphoesterase [Frankia nepalensis]MBL7627787.1 metallophosphoesterase [Frankia nepalensis]